MEWRLRGRRAPLEGVDGRPGLEDSPGMALLHRGNKIVRTGGRADGRLQVQRDENRLDAGGGEIRDDFVLLFGHPGAIPIGASAST